MAVARTLTEISPPAPEEEGRANYRISCPDDLDQDENIFDGCLWDFKAEHPDPPAVVNKTCFLILEKPRSEAAKNRVC